MVLARRFRASTRDTRVARAGAVLLALALTWAPAAAHCCSLQHLLQLPLELLLQMQISAPGATR